jgi:hypothetical protein
VSEGKNERSAAAGESLLLDTRHADDDAASAEPAVVVPGIFACNPFPPPALHLSKYPLQKHLLPFMYLS